MSKLTLWECDQCGWQHSSPNLPKGWAQAWVTGVWAEKPADMSLNTTKGYLWCAHCWGQIGTLRGIKKP